MLSNVVISEEKVSALADGQLSGVELAQTLADLGGNAAGVRTWHAYHVVGDVLRSAELARGASDFAFLRKLELRLATEALKLPETRSEGTPTGPQVVARAWVSGANAPVWRWKVTAGVACVALAGVIGMGQWSQTDFSSSTQLSSASPETAPVRQVSALDASDQMMIRDPALDSLLAAHHQLGGHSALQSPSGFLRNATYQGSAR
jgi:sigma-E factor negative regulatory protein RseA